MKIVNCGLSILALILCCLCASAQNFATLVKFDNSNGSSPGSIIQGADGQLWGTTHLSTNNCGTVFKITPLGVLSTVHAFDCSDGENPQGIIQSTDGNFYGATANGGSGNLGTIFKLTPGGVFTTVYDFANSELFEPTGITQGIDGNFYGATYGGLNDWGGIFKVTPSGKLTILYDFDFTHGAQPYAGPTAGADGNFYGTTYAGGSGGSGTVYKITPNGTLTVLHNFGQDSSDGSFPTTTLIQATDGAFYGSTPYGGLDQDGIIFKITASGDFTNLHSFNETDGRWPLSLAQASDGSFWGETAYGGNNDYGSIFTMNGAGTLRTVHKFNSNDGSSPIMLVQNTSGIFYGVTDGGGDLDCNPSYGCGTVFGLSVGFGPFIKSLPPAGKVGAKVGIMGTKLTDAISVTFNGTPAQFTVRTPSLILAEVPEGARTGKIEVTLPHQTLSSSVPFLVLH